MENKEFPMKIEIEVDYPPYFNGKYCGESCHCEDFKCKKKDCVYKSNTYCTLFNETIDYDYKKDKPFRLKECMKIFGNKRIVI